MALWIHKDKFSGTSTVDQIRRWEKELTISVQPSSSESSHLSSCDGDGGRGNKNKKYSRGRLSSSFVMMGSRTKISVYRFFENTHVCMPFWYGICQERNKLVSVGSRPLRHPFSFQNMNDDKQSVTSQNMEIFKSSRRQSVQLRPYQKEIEREALDVIKEQSGCCLMAVYPGGGKCFVKGTMIRMADGSEKRIECIRPLEYVKGIMNEPRQVRAICSSPANEDMYTLKVVTNNDGIIIPCEVTTNASHLHYIEYDDNKYMTVRADTLFSLYVNREKEDDFLLPHSCHNLKIKFLKCLVVSVDDKTKKRVEHVGFTIHKETTREEYYGISLSFSTKSRWSMGDDDDGDFVENDNDGNYYSEVPMISKTSLFQLANGLVTHNTMTAISVSGKIACPTLIVTHRVVLMNQWMESIRRMFHETEGGITVSVLSPSSYPFLFYKDTNDKKRLARRCGRRWRRSSPPYGVRGRPRLRHASGRCVSRRWPRPRSRQ